MPRLNSSAEYDAFFVGRRSGQDVNVYLGLGEFGVRVGKYDDFRGVWCGLERKEATVNIPNQLFII